MGGQPESDAQIAGDTIPLQSFLDLGFGSTVVRLSFPCLTALGMDGSTTSCSFQKEAQGTAAAQVLHETVGPINSFHLQNPTSRNILLVRGTCPLETVLTVSVRLPFNDDFTQCS